MKNKTVYLVSELVNWNDHETKIPRKVFESKNSAKKFASELSEKIMFHMEFDEEIWNEIELDFFNLTADDPNFDNNEEYSYPNNTKKYYERQLEIEKLEFNTYVELLMNKFPDSTKEDLEVRLRNQFDYLDHEFEDKEVCIDEIEYNYE